MNTIKVVDARMGRGKSTAAIHYINAHKKNTRFLYITPFLSEVARFRGQCGLEEPVKQGEDDTKLAELRKLVHQGRSISTTHSLYQLIDDELLEMIRDKQYSLIIDESIAAIEKAQITNQDRVILDGITTTDSDGIVSWIDPDYTGKFDGYKKMADQRTLYWVDGTLINTFNKNLLDAFEDVFILTYLFRGSTLEAYFQCFDIPYEIWGITGEGATCSFTPGPDQPPPIDYRPLIHIIDKRRMNEVGDPYYALAKNWYQQRSYHDPDMIQLRKNMQNFFKNTTGSNKDNRVWTCFKDHMQKLIPDNGSYANNFLQMVARATNEFSGRSNLAYMVNRFEDPNLLKFFSMRDCDINRDQCALSDMLQWIWRSSIRDGKPINLYMPSRRMRDLLTTWMNQMAEGGVANA